jgi:hypothetical protein
MCPTLVKLVGEELDDALGVVGLQARDHALLADHAHVVLGDRDLLLGDPHVLLGEVALELLLLLSALVAGDRRTLSTRCVRRRRPLRFALSTRRARVPIRVRWPLLDNVVARTSALSPANAS